MQQILPNTGPQPFEVKEGNNAIEWQNWLRSFEIFAAASGIKEEVKHNWLLHYAGLKVQNIFFNLPDVVSEKANGVPKTPGKVPFVIDDDDYSQAVAKLTNHFAPKQNNSYERHIFRKLTQGKGERIDTFVMKLREQADRCEFGNQKDDNIKDQITASCHSDLLRRKILERGDESLDSILTLARIFEAAASQQRSFTNDSKLSNDAMEEKNEVCEIDTRKMFKRKYSDQYKSDQLDGWNCGRCGLKGHKSSDEKCPAKGKECLKCGKMDHFTRKCLTKSNKEPPSKKFKREPIRMINEYDDYDDVFCVSTGESNDNKIWCKIGGIEVEVVVDSGTKRNIVDRESWLDLEARNITTTWRRREVDIGFTSYGGHRLHFIGMFQASVQVGQKQVMATFYVANELGKFLLGFETAKLLGVLKIGIDVNNVNNEVVKLSKIKDFSMTVPMKADIKPVERPYRRIPVQLERVVDEKISKMLRQDIIEKVKVSKWISPLVMAPKPNNDVRIGVDMRRVNEAVAREHHPLPTIEDFLPRLEGAVYFSKLNIEQALHQVEIMTQTEAGPTIQRIRISTGPNASPDLQEITSVPGNRLRSERLRTAPKRYGFDD